MTLMARRGEFGQHFPPPVAMGGSTDGQFECGFAAGPAHQRNIGQQFYNLLFAH